MHTIRCYAACSLIIALMPVVAESQTKRWAVISSAAVQQLGLTDVVVAELSNLPDVKLVERDRIDAVLKELTLSETVGAEAVSARLKLGKLLGADVLIFLRERQDKDKKNTVIELSIARADQGVRIRMEQLLWEAAKGDEIGKELVKIIVQARRLTERDDFQLFAVPPFESLDVGRQHEEKRSAYARLIERFLIMQDGVAVVELAEARALSQEAAITGATLKRNLPYYIIGSYKTDRQQKSLSVSFSLGLQRGEESLANAKRDELAPIQVPTALQETLNDILSKIVDRASPPADLDLEAKLLTARGDVFRHIGELEQAIELYESALLCRPDYHKAHLSLFESFTFLMEKGAYDFFMVRQLGYSPKGRMEQAESALQHLISTLTIDPKLPELFSKLTLFISSFHLIGYDIVQDWDHALPLYDQAYDLYEQLVLKIAADPTGHGLDIADFPGEIHGIMNATRSFYPANPRKALQSVLRLIVCLDSNQNPIMALQTQLIVSIAMARICKENTEIFTALTDFLKDASSERVNFLGEAIAIIAKVQDEPTLAMSLSQIEQLTNSQAHGYAVRDILKDTAQQRYREIQQQHPDKHEFKALMLPSLNCLNTTSQLTYNGRTRSIELPRVNDWLTCGPELELLGAERAVYKITSPGQLEYFFTSTAIQLHWDGKYVWVVGREFISVLTASGHEFVRFKVSEVESMNLSHEFRFVSVSPGKMCMIGLVHLEPSGIRTWAGILHAEEGPNGYLVKRVEPFFQARSQKSQPDDTDDMERSFSPRWAVALPHGGQNREFVIVVDRGTLRPLILDPARKTSRVMAHHWPKKGCVVREGDGVYLSPGAGEEQTIRFVEKADELPREIINLFSNQESSPLIPHSYNSIAIWENKLHLIGNLKETGFEGPYSWIAVDLSTQQAYALGDPLPAQSSILPSLALSGDHGLGLLSWGRAFAVKLPPTSDWVRLETRAAIIETRPSNQVDELTGRLTKGTTTAPAPVGNETRTFRGHTDEIMSVVFCQDGRRALSGGYFLDRTISLWDTRRDKVIRTFYGFYGAVYGLACSMDGKFVVSACCEMKTDLEGFIRIMDIETGKEVRNWKAPDKLAFTSLAVSSDGSKIVSGDSAGSIRVWDFANGRELYQFPTLARGIWSVSLSHCDQMILSPGVSSDGFIMRLSDIETGREIRQFRGHTKRLTCVAFSPDDRLALSSSADKTIRLWDVSSGKEIRQFHGHETTVNSVAWLPDGKRFISGGGPGRARKWLNQDGTVVDQKERAPQNGDNSLRLWSIDSDKEIAKFEGHALRVRSIAISPDGKYALSGSDDATVRLWTLPPSQ